MDTRGLRLIQAMACALPVVASDWNGYRDLVINGETGFLVPTVMVTGATADSTARLVLETQSYDHFLAETSQAVAVDCAAAARAFASDTARIALPPSLDLFGVPSSSIIVLSIRFWSNAE